MNVLYTTLEPNEGRLRADPIDAESTAHIAPDDSMFAKLYVRHRPFVRRVLTDRGISSSDVEDALQDVFLTLLRRAPVFTTERCLRAWLREVAVRVALNRLRSRRRREPYWMGVETSSEPELVEDTSAPSPERFALVHEQFLRACTIIDRLDSKGRNALILRYFEELSLEEIGSLVGCRENTVASRLRAARNALRYALQARFSRR